MELVLLLAVVASEYFLYGASIIAYIFLLICFSSWYSWNVDTAFPLARSFFSAQISFGYVGTAPSLERESVTFNFLVWTGLNGMAKMNPES